MFHKTGSRIKQFISPKRNKKAREKDEWSHDDVRQKRDLGANSWISQGRKSLDESFFRRVNSSTAMKAASPPLPSPLSTQCSLRSFCECGCNSPTRSPPHSLSKFDTPSGTSKDLCLRPDEYPRLVLASRSNSAITFLPRNNTSVKCLYQTPVASQIDLLEALALEPDGDSDKTTHQESLTMRNHGSDEPSKDVRQLLCETKHAFKVSEYTITNITATIQELGPNQNSPNSTTRKMAPRIDARDQYRALVLPKVILTQPESAMPQEHERPHINGSKLVNKPHALPDSAQIPAETRKRSLIVSSREQFKQIILSKRAVSNSVAHLSVESLGESSLRLSSETSRSTASGSTGSTPLEPFHLEDLPLRIKLAAGQLAERPEIQRIEIQRSIASTLTLQKPTSIRSFGPFPVREDARNSQYTSVSNHEVVLKSTNFSLTSSLGYKHGDIRVKQRRMPATKPGPSSAPRSGPTVYHTTSSQAENSTSQAADKNGLQDEELDMQGFQMAVSGASSCHWMKECEDCLADGPHPGLEELEVKVDELVKWCDDFGLDMGMLVKTHPPGDKVLHREVLRRRMHVHPDAGAETARDAVGLLETGQHSRIDPERAGEDPINHPPWEAIKGQRETSSKGGRDETGKGNHDGEASLPPSPMQTINPSALARPNSFVPMGFNVDHDLRDYLKWKCECVNGTAD